MVKLLRETCTLESLHGIRVGAGPILVGVNTPFTRDIIRGRVHIRVRIGHVRVGPTISRTSIILYAAAVSTVATSTPASSTGGARYPPPCLDSRFPTSVCAARSRSYATDRRNRDIVSRKKTGSPTGTCGECVRWTDRRRACGCLPRRSFCAPAIKNSVWYRLISP